MKYKIEYYILIIFIKLIMLFPEKLRYKFAEKLGILGYYLIKKRRQIALANLQLAFPEKSIDEIKKLAKENYKILSKSYFSSLWIKDFIFDESRVSVENYHILDEAYSENKGVIGVMMHMGPIEVLCKLSEKYRLVDVVKAQRNPYIDRYISKNRSQFNMEFLKKNKNTTKNLLKAVRAKEVIGLFSDHRDKGTTIKFFGLETVAPTGAVHFALKFKMPLVFIYAILNSDNTSSIKIVKKVQLIDTGNFKEDIHTNTQNIIYLMEDAIREHPEQWLWLHDRWKLSKELNK